MAEPAPHAGSVHRPGSLAIVTVRYFAAARAAAGVAEELLSVPALADISIPDGGDARAARVTVAAVLSAASDRHGPGLARVLLRCSYLLDEVAVHGTDTAVRDGQVLDVLPPFAGGSRRGMAAFPSDHGR